MPACEFKPTRARRLAVALGFAAAFLIVDQLTKAVVRQSMVPGVTSIPVVPGILNLEYVRNLGAAFSLASGQGPLLVALAVVMVAASLAYLWRAPLISRLEAVGLGMLMGGAVGNAIDRALFGFVTDFFATQFIDFPVFNVADIGITVGVAIAFLGFMFLSPANADARRRAEEDRARRTNRDDRGE